VPGLVPLSHTDRWSSGKSAASPVFFVSKLREKLLDDTKPTLYCDHQFDRQFALSLS
jgi:hypothetical protein